jgi:hypothetical protein
MKETGSQRFRDVDTYRPSETTPDAGEHLDVEVDVDVADGLRRCGHVLGEHAVDTAGPPRVAARHPPNPAGEPGSL